MVIAIPLSVRTLLAGAIDYAGLFPPAALSMPEAVAEYQRCRSSAEAWALGRFVVPASRLGEFGRAAQAGGLLPSPAPCRLSALIGDDADAQLAAIDQFNATHEASGTLVDAVECRAATPAGVREQVSRFAARFECWIEVVPGPNLPALLDAMAGSPAGPKIRMGGVELAAFPDPGQVVQFLSEVVRRSLAFKATAGLHHPVRGEYRLTDAPDSPAGPMYGYLNLLLATALLQAGAGEQDARAVLLEEAPAAFDCDETGLAWRGFQVPLAGLQQVRRDGMRSFGSCSFREPLSDLQQILVP
ncbi:MAG: hypothetical protein SGI84_14270 [Gemmatimonadota bacterium]|nr:hypothetical protein [Gemmatimonadota bacterium]